MIALGVFAIVALAALAYVAFLAVILVWMSRATSEAWWETAADEIDALPESDPAGRDAPPGRPDPTNR